MQTNSQDSKTTKPTSKARPRVKKSDAGKSDGAETLHLKSKAIPNATIDEVEISEGHATSGQATADTRVVSMIAEAAYFIAQRRSFAPGHELEDWLQAEQQIRTRKN